MTEPAPPGDDDAMIDLPPLSEPELDALEWFVIACDNWGTPLTLRLIAEVRRLRGAGGAFEYEVGYRDGAHLTRADGRETGEESEP